MLYYSCDTVPLKRVSGKNTILIFVNCLFTVMNCIIIVNNKVKFNEYFTIYLAQIISLGGIY